MARWTGAVVVVGASAGGVEALKALVSGLPADLPAAAVVVLHLAPGGPSVLAQILDRETQLNVVSAVDGQALSAGTVYVGPPDQHTTLDHETIRLSQGPPHHYHRPSVDLLFGSAAATLGSRVIGVVLSGALNDGAEGLAKIVGHGGKALIQDPTSADYPDMPANALAAVPNALQLPLERLADGVIEACGGPARAAHR